MEFAPKRQPLRRAAFFPVVAFSVFMLQASCVAVAGDWRVAPIRIDLDRTAKTGSVTVYNESDERLELQIKAMEWIQDSDGKDRYADTEDLVFFPKMMVFDRKGEKVVRAGIRAPAVREEKAYRLFLEEIPEARKGTGVSIGIAVRFGVPVFVKPVKAEPKGELTGVVMSGGELSLSVRNAGNTHFFINSVRLRGRNAGDGETFLSELRGWYVLPGAARNFGVKVPAEDCRKTVRVDIEVQTDSFPMKGNLVTDASMCGP